MSSKGAICLLLLILVFEGSKGNTKYILDTRTDASQLFKTKNLDNLRILYHPEMRHSFYDGTKRQDFEPQINRRSSYVETSTFNPDVLNKFLEEYANKIKLTTENNYKNHPYLETTEAALTLGNDDDYAFATTDNDSKSTESSIKPSVDKNEMQNETNDTLQRNKYWTANPQDDRNGWVTLDAIPWSKSKISKWQANPSTQNPWPDMKPWDTPNSVKPWQSDYPHSYETNIPWLNRPKPTWSENQQQSRPPYPHNQVQKWPPERPSWDKNPHRPDTDIITDNRPSNFPSNWDRIQMAKPSFPWNKFTNNNDGDFNDWNHQSNPPNYSGYNEQSGRPPFFNYQYDGVRPSNHPATGDGQWVLLSTNRGYSKSRQRSIKFNASNGDGLNVTDVQNEKQDDKRPTPILSSRRQVRSNQKV